MNKDKISSEARSSPKMRNKLIVRAVVGISLIAAISLILREKDGFSGVENVNLSNLVSQ